MPRNDALRVERGAEPQPESVSSTAAPSSVPPPDAGSVARLSLLQSLLWKEEVVRLREKSTLARLEQQTRDISALTLEIISLRDAIAHALHTQQPVSVSKPGAQSRPLGYQQEQLYRQLFLRVQGDPRVFARAVQRAEMDADEMAAMANFVVYHLFARCDRASHPDSSGVLLLIDELHAASAEAAADVEAFLGPATLLRHLWSAYFRRIAKPYLSQALREMIVNISAMPDPHPATPAPKTPAPRIELEPSASASRAMQESPVGRFLIPSGTPQTSARRSMSAALSSMVGTPVQGTPARGTPTGAGTPGGGGAGAPPVTPATPGAGRYPPMALDALLAFGKKIVACIVDNVDSVPPQLRWVVRSAWRHASARFASDDAGSSTARLYSAMSCMLFWSLLREALVFPELSGSMEPLEVNPPTRDKLRQIERVLSTAFTGDDIDDMLEASSAFDSETDRTEQVEMFRSKLSKMLPMDSLQSYVDRLVADGDVLQVSLAAGVTAGRGGEGDTLAEAEWPIAAYPNDLFAMHRALGAHFDTGAAGEEGDGDEEGSSSLRGLLQEMGVAAIPLPLERNHLFAMLPRFSSRAESEAEAVSKRYLQAADTDEATTGCRSRTKKKLCAVLTGLPKSAFSARGEKPLPLADVLLQQRDEVRFSTGGRALSNTLYETFLSLEELPAADKADDFMPFLDDLCAEKEEIIAVYSRLGLDAQGDGAGAVGEEYIFHLKQESATLQHQKEELDEHVAQLLVRKVATPAARPIQTAVKQWLATTCPDCEGESDINEDAFLCAACCKHMAALNGRVVDFLGRFDAELASMRPTVGLRLADWAIARAHESLFPMCEENDQFAAHMQSLQFITPDFGTFYEYLMEDYGGATVPPLLVHEESLMLVMEELLRINMYRGPNRKLQCIAEFWDGVVKLLGLTQRAPAADDYLPLLS